MEAHCVPCKEAGRGLVVAHYKAISASRSHNGKSTPPMCFFCRNNKTNPLALRDAKGDIVAVAEEQEVVASPSTSDAEEEKRLARWRAVGMCGLPDDSETLIEPYCNRQFSEPHRIHRFDRHIKMPDWYTYQVIITGKERPAEDRDILFDSCEDGKHEECRKVSNSEQEMVDGHPYLINYACTCECHIKRGRGRKPGANYKLEERAQAITLLKEGKSTRVVAVEVGLAKRTVDLIRQEVADDLPPLCECGRPNGHRGWCKKRVEASPSRQGKEPEMTPQDKARQAFGKLDEEAKRCVALFKEAGYHESALPLGLQRYLGLDVPQPEQSHKITLSESGVKKLWPLVPFDDQVLLLEWWLDGAFEDVKKME